jgi:hypothetical protein
LPKMRPDFDVKTLFKPNQEWSGLADIRGSPCAA